MSPPRRWQGIALGLVGAAALVAALLLARAARSDDAAATATAAPAMPAPATAATGDAANRGAASGLGAATDPQGAGTGGGPQAAARATATAGASAPSVDEVMAAQRDPSPAAIDVLVAGLSATDAVATAEAANGLVARGALSALPALVELDVAARPWAAPSIIYAMGKLGAVADAEERGAVVARLIALLAQEKRRAAPESMANVLQIYEALAQTGDARAIPPLEAELGDAAVGAAPKVVVVQALVALGARQSRPALERLRDQIAPTATGEDLEAAVRRDLLAAIRDALVQLS